MKCKFLNSGCKMRVRYEDLVKHENECEFGYIVCEMGCNMSIPCKSFTVS